MQTQKNRGQKQELIKRKMRVHSLIDVYREKNEQKRSTHRDRTLKGQKKQN